jgi:hypothetical protein
VFPGVDCLAMCCLLSLALLCFVAASSSCLDLDCLEMSFVATRFCFPW